MRDYLAAIGRTGGKQKSAAKTAAVTENAKQPRPNAKGKKKPRTARTNDR